MIQFFSTNEQSPPVNLRDALLIGQAPDKGLYLPREFPNFTSAGLAEISTLPYAEIAFRVLAKYSQGIIHDEAACRRGSRRDEVPLRGRHRRG